MVLFTHLLVYNKLNNNTESKITNTFHLILIIILWIVLNYNIDYEIIPNSTQNLEF